MQISAGFMIFFSILGNVQCFSNFSTPYQLSEEKSSRLVVVVCRDRENQSTYKF